jgi:hypothetical protein
MSILSYTSPDFIEYLYENDVTISVYESYDRTTQTKKGHFDFLSIDKSKDYGRLHYYEDKKNIVLHTTWTTSFENPAQFLLYFYFIHFRDNMKVALRYTKHNKHNKQEINKKDIPCFLCLKETKEKCLLCECKSKDIINCIEEIHSVKENNISNRFRALENIFIKFSRPFVRSILHQNNFDMINEEYMGCNDCGEKIIYGSISIRHLFDKNIKSSSIDFTVDTKGKNNLLFTISTLPSDLIKFLINYFLEIYTDITVRVLKNNNKDVIVTLYTFFHKSGFTKTLTFQPDLSDQYDTFIKTN